MAEFYRSRNFQIEKAEKYEELEKVLLKRLSYFPKILFWYHVEYALDKTLDKPLTGVLDIFSFWVASELRDTKTMDRINSKYSLKTENNI